MENCQNTGINTSTGVKCEDCGEGSGPENSEGVKSGTQYGEYAGTSALRDVKWQAETEEIPWTSRAKCGGQDRGNTWTNITKEIKDEVTGATHTWTCICSDTIKDAQ